MTGSAQFRSLSFGDVDGGLWGGAIELGAPALALGAGAATTSLAGAQSLEWSTDGRRWTLAGDGLVLEATPEGEALDPPAPPSMEMTGVEELCRVAGRITIGGSEQTVDCVGTRCAVDGLDSGAVDSVRAVSGWFSAREAFALLAFRARGGGGHESDLIAATLFDPDGWVPVSDPRLSTTYAASGAPVRTSLELWVGDEDNELPRRAAGEATGAEASARAPGLQLRVLAFRCHSRGLEGSGVYLLATR